MSLTISLKAFSLGGFTFVGGTAVLPANSRTHVGVRIVDKVVVQTPAATNVDRSVIWLATCTTTATDVTLCIEHDPLVQIELAELAPISGADYMSFNQNPSTVPETPGTVYWDAEELCLAFRGKSTGTVCQIGRELWARVRNNSGVDIPDGAAVVVTGAIGGYPTVRLASALTDTHLDTLGVTTEAIAKNAFGEVTTAGDVNGLAIPAGWEEGDTLYLSNSPGVLTNTPPGDPSFAVSMGLVLRAHATNGRISVRVQNATDPIVALDPDNLSLAVITGDERVAIKQDGAWTATTLGMVGRVGTSSVVMSGSSVTLTAAQYGKPTIVITGAITANLNLIFPAIAGEWTVINDTTGGYSITAKTDSGTGVALGTVTAVVGDGTNIYTKNADAVQITKNVASLKNITPVSTHVLRTRGYYSDGDGGEGCYHAVAGFAPGTYVDNGFTVILPHGGDGSSAWLLSIGSGRISIKQAGAKGDGVAEDTVAINNAFTVAMNLSRGVYAPAGTYLVGALLFGQQSTSSQSRAPTGLCGDGWTTIFKAKAGFTGTVLQAWSVAGIEFNAFDVEGSGTATTCIDTTWKAWVGPSVQNIYTRVRAQGCTGTVWDCASNNDCTFIRCSVTGAGHGVIGFNYTASGGLAWMQDCTWNNSYLLFGCQNGVIYNSWGHGIAFAQGCLNYVGIIGCYIYDNTVADAVLWSESFASYQSVHGLFCSSTQFIGIGNTGKYFNLNAYSTLDFFGCQWIGTTTTMFGSSCRSDSFASVKALFRGGSVLSHLTINQPGGFIIEQDGLMDDNTALNRPNKRSSIYATNAASGNYNSGTYYDLIPSGTLEEGTYLIDWSWNHNGAGQPFLLHGSAIVSILALDVVGGGNGPDIACNLSSYFTGDGQSLAFRLQATGSGPKVQFKWTGGADSGTTLQSPGYYIWKAVKLA